MPQFARDPLTGDADDQPNMHIERLSRFAPVLDEMVETDARARHRCHGDHCRTGAWSV
jgi:glutamine synthetase